MIPIAASMIKFPDIIPIARNAMANTIATCMALILGKKNKIIGDATRPYAAPI